MHLHLPNAVIRQNTGRNAHIFPGNSRVTDHSGFKGKKKKSIVLSHSHFFLSAHYFSSASWRSSSLLTILNYTASVLKPAKAMFKPKSQWVRSNHHFTPLPHWVLGHAGNQCTVQSRLLQTNHAVSVHTLVSGSHNTMNTCVLSAVAIKTFWAKTYPNWGKYCDWSWAWRVCVPSGLRGRGKTTNRHLLTENGEAEEMGKGKEGEDVWSEVELQEGPWEESAFCKGSWEESAFCIWRNHREPLLQQRLGHCLWKNFTWLCKEHGSCWHLETKVRLL